MTIHRLSGTDTLNDLRFVSKMMASLLRGKNLKCGTVPLRKLTEKVHDGTVTVKELDTWFGIAVDKLNKPQ